jgi:hypothetical protein
VKRAVDIGLVDAAAIKTAGGKVRLRLLFTVDQLAALMEAASEETGDAAGADADVSRTVTHRHAPDKTQSREEDGGGEDARATPPQRTFVIEGTRAWDAWMARKLKETGRKWTLKTTRIEGGKRQSGWYFDSLFPPSSTGPPNVEAEEIIDQL